VKEGSSAAIKEVMCALQDLLLASSSAGEPSGDPLLIADAQKGAELQAVRKALVELGLRRCWRFR
jgi:hypothetical protein